MSDLTPTRSVVLELADERRAMREGHGFLDEKCLLLAGEMLRQLVRHASVEARMQRDYRTAIGTLAAAAARHGLQALQVYPTGPATQCRLESARRSLMGVRLNEAHLALDQPPPTPPPDGSPEAEACRIAFASLASAATELAASVGNLERLHAEYRRAVRRARALQDVLLPEVDRTLSELETRLAELEQEDAIWMRHGR